MHLATPSFGIPHTRQSRKRAARIYLACICALVLLADAALLMFVFSDSNPLEALIGVVVGQAVSTPLLIAGVWRRMAWARFFLIILLFVVAGIFGIVVVSMSWRPEARETAGIVRLTIAVALILGANSWLIRSKRIQYLARTGEAQREDSSLL